MISSEGPLFYSHLDIPGFSPVACTVHIKIHSSLRLIFGHFRSRKSVNNSSEIRAVLAGNMKQIVQQKINYDGNLFINQNLRINGLVLELTNFLTAEITFSA